MKQEIAEDQSYGKRRLFRVTFERPRTSEWTIVLEDGEEPVTVEDARREAEFTLEREYGEGVRILSVLEEPV